MALLSSELTKDNHVLRYSLLYAVRSSQEQVFMRSTIIGNLSDRQFVTLLPSISGLNN